MHAPAVPAVMFALEKTRKMKFHPVVCFIATWIGGLALGFLIGPLVIDMLR